MLDVPTTKVTWMTVMYSPILEQNFRFDNLNLLKLTANQTKVVADVQSITFDQANHIPLGGKCLKYFKEV